MKPLTHLLLTAIFIFLSLNSRSQNSTSKYTDCDKGIDLYWKKKFDSAFLMFNNYVNAPDDSLKKGRAYSYMGEIQWNIGDLYGAQESLTGAIKTLNPLIKEQREELGDVYNILGNVSLDLKLYDNAINFYDSAISFSNVSDAMFEFMNGKATALQKRGSYGKAVAIYNSILYLKPYNQQIVARVIDNRAHTKWLQNPAYPALNEFQAALKIRLDSQYTRGLNASYAHLSDYYARSKPGLALLYAQKMHETAKENQNPDDVLEAIDKLIRLSSDRTVIENLYDEFKRVSDSLQFSRDTTKNRFAFIRYNYQKNKADNLTLQYTIEKSKADNLVLKEHITRQRIWTYGVSILALTFIAMLWVWYAKRRRKIKQYAENEIRDARLKTSQKIHDVVANGLYRIMNELEHGKEIEKEPLINKIEGLYEQSRDISYEDVAPDNSTDYSKQVHDLLVAFDSRQTKVFIVGNEQAFWNKVSPYQKNELQLVLNEIMVNMKKHSRAKNIVILFRNEDNKRYITYTDDGTGFPSDIEFGNGLKNTVSRIKSLGGEINFGKSDKDGALIAISFSL